MKALWVGWRDLYASRRMVDEAAAVGLSLEAAEITEISFVADGDQIGAFWGGRDLADAFDLLCIRTFHPHISEVLTLARVFRDAGKPVVDESLSDEGYAVSKMHDYLLLARAGVPVPRSRQFYDRRALEDYATSLGFPCVLKGVHGSQGLHVHKARDIAQLRRLVRQYPDGELMVQEYLDAREDVRVLVVGYRALRRYVIRHPRPGDFRTNFAVEGEGLSAELAASPELGVVAERAARVLRREFAGVDLRQRGDRMLVLEVNRRPDFEGFEDSTGLNVARELASHLKARLDERRRLTVPGDRPDVPAMPTFRP